MARATSRHTSSLRKRWNSFSLFILPLYEWIHEIHKKIIALQHNKSDSLNRNKGLNEQGVRDWIRSILSERKIRIIHRLATPRPSTSSTAKCHCWSNCRFWVSSLVLGEQIYTWEGFGRIKQFAFGRSWRGREFGVSKCKLFPSVNE